MTTRSVTANGYVDDLRPIGLTPEAAERKHARRLNGRLIAGVLCVLAAFSGFLVFSVSSSPRTHGVVVSVRDMPVGTRLRRADLAIAQAQLADAQAQVFVLAEALEAVEGQELLAPVAAQQPLARAQLTTSHRPTLQPGFVRMTVPVRPDTAVGGALRTGDVVTVLATADKGKPSAQTRPVLDRVVVDQTGQSDTLATTGASAPTADGGGAALPLRANRPIAWVTLDELAALAACSRSTINDRFGRLLGRAPMQYLNDWRLQVAAGLLRDTTLGVAGVAYRIGYESEEAFNRAFKRAMGSPPAQWRQSAAAKGLSQPA